MSEIAVSADGLGKKYRIGASATGQKRLREAVSDMTRTPWRETLRLARRSAGTNGAGRPEFWALKDVSFEVKRGEVLGIIGRNGAGKSTLLKVLSQITEPTTGRVEIRGRVASLLEVGTGFHPELTGRENVFLNGAILGMSRLEIMRKFDEIVAFAEVDQFIDTPVKHYSSGMYLRLAFAVAAHLEPEILIVDEVLAVGDAAFQKKCLEKMGDVSHEGRTVLFVSHNMTAVSALSGRGLLLQQGHVEMHGPIGATVAAYTAQAHHTSGLVDLLDHPANNSPAIKFEELSVYQNGEGPLAALTTDTDIEVRLAYNVLHPIRGIEVSIAVELADGQYLLSTTDVDTSLDVERFRPAGRYTARCFLPAAFFRAGTYYLHCGSSRPNMEQLSHVRRALGFDVLDINGVETQVGQRRLGILSPRLGWTTEYDN